MVGESACLAARAAVEPVAGAGVQAVMRRRGFLGLLFVAPLAKAVAVVRPKPDLLGQATYEWWVARNSLRAHRRVNLEEFFAQRLNELERSFKENLTKEKILELYQ